MRTCVYILLAIFILGSGSNEPLWLCVGADGHVDLKTDVEASCESACRGEADASDDKGPVTVSAPDGRCLDIPLGFSGEFRPAKPVRVQQSYYFSAAPQAITIQSRSANMLTEFALLTSEPPPDSSRPSFLIRTVALLL